MSTLTTHATTTAPETGPRLNMLPIAALIAAGIAFAMYPILRGSAVETGFSGAELYARPA
jgi:hypothetical protein